MSSDFLICPICKKDLFFDNGSLKCENKHSFDIAKSGYVNLLNPGKKNNYKAGDSKEMISARTNFFISGAYSKISDFLIDIISEFENKVVIDAGCGEGYYTENIAKAFEGSLVFGFDISKFGAEHAAKSAKRNNVSNASFYVSNIFDLPIKSNSCDIVTNMFAPIASEEFSRILRAGGFLIVAAAGKEHLMGLKRVLYETPYENEANVPGVNGFIYIKTLNLKYQTLLKSKEDINNLFMMTPYYHRTSLADKEKLKSIDNLQTTVEVDFHIYKKI